MTLGIEPANFRLVAWCLNQVRYRMLLKLLRTLEILLWAVGGQDTGSDWGDSVECMFYTVNVSFDIVVCMSDYGRGFDW
jgi:hypothetical protein